MTNVISYKEEEWDTLILLKDSIDWYQKNNSKGTFSNAIDIDTKAYKEYLSKYIR